MKNLFFAFIFAFSSLHISAQTNTLWQETWEGNWTAEWYVDNGTWQVGTPSGSGPGKAFAGSRCAATVLNGNYSENVSTRLIKISALTIPSDAIEPRIRLWQWFSFGDADTGFFQVKIPGGDWVSLAKYAGTGGSVWSSPEYDLSQYRGKQIQISFLFKSVWTGYYGSADLGWYLDNISLVSGSRVYYSSETFENGIGDWQASHGTWETGIPSSGPGKAYTGSNCVATNLKGNYNENADSRFVSPAFSIPQNAISPRIRFWQWYSFGDADTGRFQISVDFGDWQTLDKYTASGGSVWSCPEIDLELYKGKSVRIAFYFKSLWTGYYGSADLGWYIDDVDLRTSDRIFPLPTEQFENGIRDWFATHGTWEVGKPTSGPNGGYLSQNCLSTRLAGNYNEGVKTRFVSPRFRKDPSSSNANLRFWHWYSFGDSDTGYVEIRESGGFWQKVSSSFTSSSSGVWTNYYIDLSSYTSEIQIAFKFISNWTGYYGSSDVGWYVDMLYFTGCQILTEVEESYNIPTSYSLSQNYPNPFNPETKINYELSKPGYVTLKVYDMLGRDIASLVEGEKPAGSHIVSFDASQLASGVYFYTIKAGSFSRTRKMVLMR
ncbi:MAG: T9SS type A sorting domain-containing protein [Ignavibacteriales bacterium]|nr:T9SS type A sorting domain-containing protein [Ignavibacteriales bacterium]MCF8306536.1 T9SS type A sorting domain-containing protein [Ignavibacteriales bacterium]MCF8316335.1 T9SS type A sorting domain-containing protein [Ignavibacteriales bacterium]MCF8437707.1 T9SS type A sorting domain-containing protein [Ignavibacteriales bacterium]